MLSETSATRVEYLKRQGAEVMSLDVHGAGVCQAPVFCNRYCISELMT